jgi:hypothetical protein
MTLSVTDWDVMYGLSDIQTVLAVVGEECPNLHTLGLRFQWDDEVLALVEADFGQVGAGAPEHGVGPTQVAEFVAGWVECKSTINLRVRPRSLSIDDRTRCFSEDPQQPHRFRSAPSRQHRLVSSASSGLVSIVSSAPSLWDSSWQGGRRRKKTEIKNPWRSSAPFVALMLKPAPFWLKPAPYWLKSAPF